MAILQQSNLIGRRIRVAREGLGLSQQQLAAALRLEHRQSVAAIEAGERRLSAEELLLAMTALGKDLDYFTDPFRLVGEGQFSFRAKTGVSAGDLEAFEQRAGTWIAAFRALEAESASPSGWLVSRLPLQKRSSFEDAWQAGEWLANAWQLGEVPARRLRGAMETHLDALVLNVKAPSGISGAALQLPPLNTVLINCREPAGRRHFNLAHELFHLLTWESMPPERVEAALAPRGGNGHRVEQLAENFAAGVLMPSRLLLPRWQQRDPATDLHHWFGPTAAHFGVSGSALAWRLHNLGCITKAEAVSINPQPGTPAAAEGTDWPTERLFSERFVRRFAEAMENGRLSVRRAAGLLALSLRELAELLLSYGIEPAFEP